MEYPNNIEIPTSKPKTVENCLNALRESKIIKFSQEIELAEVLTGIETNNKYVVIFL